MVVVDRDFPIHLFNKSKDIKKKKREMGIWGHDYGLSSIIFSCLLESSLFPFSLLCLFS